MLLFLLLECNLMIDPYSVNFILFVKHDQIFPSLSHASAVKSHRRKSLSSSQVLKISSLGVTFCSLPVLGKLGKASKPVLAHLLGSSRARKDGGAGPADMSAVAELGGFLALSLDQKLVL